MIYAAEDEESRSRGSGDMVEKVLKFWIKLISETANEYNVNFWKFVSILGLKIEDTN